MRGNGFDREEINFWAAMLVLLVSIVATPFIVLDVLALRENGPSHPLDIQF